jgi:hypothetical protein
MSTSVRSAFLAWGMCVCALSAASAQAIVAVPQGGNLQAALDGAAPGTIIELAPGATYTGNFVVRGSRSQLTIRTGGDPSALPGPGQRIDPRFSPWLAKLKSANRLPALAIDPGATHITIENVEFLPSADAMATMLALGAADSRQADATLAPQHIVVDRVLANVPDGLGQLRGIALNSAHTWIVNCHLAGIKASSYDSQAIAGWNGPGPFVIENNYLEGAGENILFGGGDPATSGLVPTGIHIRWNHLAKPVKWRGLSWTVKNTLELKSAQDVVIEGNLLEYNWKAAQNGYSIVLTPRNQEGGAPHTVVQRVRFVNNWVRHVSSVFNVLGRDDKYPTLQTNDIEIRNNVFEDVSHRNWGGDGRLMMIEGTDDVRIVHNTSINTGTAIVAYGNPSYGFVLENNVLNYGHYGIIGSDEAPGTASITRYFPGSVVLGNVMPNNPEPWKFPKGNSYPPTWADVGLVDFAGGDYRLAETSQYLRAGTDGATPGANIPAVRAALVAPVAPPTCRVTVSPVSLHVGAAEGVATVQVSANYGFCGWDAASDQLWASVSPTAGVSSGVVEVSVSANTATSERTATLTIAGVPVALTQGAAAAPSPCTYSVTPTAYAAPATGGTIDVTLTASAPTCGWTASSNKTWVSIAPTAGSGSATVRLTIAAHTNKNSRSATVTVGGQAIAITQAGATAAPACSFTVSPTTYAAPAEGGQLDVTLVASDPSCTWSASSNQAWAAAHPGSGTGSDIVRITVAPNETSSSRSATVTIGGRSVSVTQAASQQAGEPACTFTVSPTTHNAAATAGSFTVTVAASAGSCSWGASSSATWITVGASGGTGSGSLAITVAENTTAASRTGSVTVAGELITVTQAGRVNGKKK